MHHHPSTTGDSEQIRVQEGQRRMKYQKDSDEYKMNRASFREMEEIVPMTSIERSQFLNWILAGHDLDSNPWHYFEPDGSPMNFLKALRIRCGYSHGPWDSWEYAVYLILHSDNDEQRDTFW